MHFYGDNEIKLLHERSGNSFVITNRANHRVCIPARSPIAECYIFTVDIL